MLREAAFYKRLAGSRVQCLLCPHQCRIATGENGLCRGRLHKDGHLYAANYGKVSSLALDPIQKKPLYHFYPGKRVLSLGTFGCNLSCSFCQNYTLAHENPDFINIAPDELVQLAARSESAGSVGVAFTYNEPLIWFEYIYDCASLLKASGFKVVLVTNGYIQKEPLLKLLDFVDAMNIDVKAFNPRFYRQHCKGDLDVVLNTVELAAGKCHIEVTNLLIPDENDSVLEVERLAKWLGAIDSYIPVHFSRYHPAYHFTRPETPLNILDQARDEAQKYLKFVYLGNVPNRDNSTFCLECGNELVQRTQYDAQISGISEGRCTSCLQPVDYIIM